MRGKVIEEEKSVGMAKRSEVDGGEGGQKEGEEDWPSSKSREEWRTLLLEGCQ